MKRTLTINLNGFVFNIDEDAYQTLNQYLEDLGRHFAADEKEEILKDIEARVAELFSEKLVNRNVVEMKDVQEVIEQLGQPSQFEDESGTQSEAQSAESQQPFTAGERRKSRKLYRDTANKKIGGVAAGVAAYMDWDPTIVRILFLLIMLFSLGWSVFIYILMWIFIPEANSVAQRLEMQGVEPTAENIGSYAATNETPVASTPSPLAKILKVIAIVLLSIIGIGLFASVMGVLIATIMLVFHLLPIAVGINEILLLTSIGVFLIVPAIAIVMFCVYLVGNRKPRHKWTAWVLLGLWLASIVGMSVFGVNAYNHRDKWDSEEIQNGLLKYWDDDDADYDADYDDQYYSNEDRDNGDFHAIDAEEAITVRFVQGDSTSVEVKAPQSKIGKVRTDIRNGVLYIRNENQNMKGNQRIIVCVTAPQLDKIKMSEACNFECEGDVNFQKLEVQVEEASRVRLAGKIDTLTVRAEEAAHADLEDVTADVATIRAEEASHVAMGTARELRIQTAEASAVTYKGKPQLLQKSSSEFSVVTNR